MSARSLSLAPRSAALLAACQSSPTAQHAPEAEAATAAADAQRTHQAAAAARSEQATLDSIVVTGTRLHRGQAKAVMPTGHVYAPPAPPAPVMAMEYRVAHAPLAPPANTEKYAERDDNPVKRTLDEPVSTFSVDVDTAADVRRLMLRGASATGA